MICYCLFCDTVRCGTIAKELERHFPLKAISPKMIQHTWSKGNMIDREQDLLPGYIFLYTEEPWEKVGTLWRLKGIHRILGEREDGYALQGTDERFALALLKLGGTLGKTPVYEVGQRIHLADEAFAGVEAKILKVNHRNHRLQIELPFADTLVKTWVEYEMIERDLSAELEESLT